MLRVELLLGGLCIELRLLNFRRQVGGGGGGILGLGLIVAALILLRGGGQITIFEDREQLAGADVAPAIDQKFLDRRADLRNNRRLRDREQHCIGGYFLL